jgi:predicted ATP-grasp superfamily ATP-dependent carboligase
MTAGALVLGADYRALGIARSLGRRGISVCTFRHDPTVANWSRYIRRRFEWPESTEEEQVAWLVTAAERHGLTDWTLFVTTDAGAALVARHREALAKAYRLVSSPWDTVRVAYDKRLTYQLAASIGLAQPDTFVPKDRAELEDKPVSFPAILKPAVKAGTNAFTVDKAWPVADRKQLLQRYAEATALIPAELVMVQELIPGGGESQFSFGALCDEGTVLASVTARRLRQYPIDFGHSSSAVETLVDERVEHAARALLGALGYTGIVEVEFKRDARDGKYKLLDVNPRFWTWHTLCGRAGVDFPYLLWLQSRGEPLPDVSAVPGVVWTRLATDVRAAVAEMRRGRLSLRQYLKRRPGSAEPALFALDDPVPALVDVPLLVRRALSGG